MTGTSMANEDKPSWLFRGFGMTIRSDVYLPELTPVESAETDPAPDLVISRGKVDRPDPEPPFGRDHSFGQDEQYLGLAVAGKYLIRGTGHIIFEPTPALPEGLAGFALLGPVMATLLHVRGNLVLHGSALLVDGKAALFLGDKGAGKPTMAGAMINAGYPLITDDVIAVAHNGDAVPAALPSYPTLKLSDAALGAMDPGAFSILPSVDGIAKKRALPRLPLAEAPVPIARIYILRRGEPGAPAAVALLSAGEALSALLANSYMARYGPDAFGKPGGMAHHMGQCASLVRHASVARLTVPGQIDRLSEAVAAVVEDSREPGR